MIDPLTHVHGAGSLGRGQVLPEGSEDGAQGRVWINKHRYMYGQSSKYFIITFTFVEINIFSATPTNDQTPTWQQLCVLWHHIHTPSSRPVSFAPSQHIWSMRTTCWSDAPCLSFRFCHRAAGNKSQGSANKS